MAFKILQGKYITIDSARKANWFYHYMKENRHITSMSFATSPQMKAEIIVKRLDFETTDQQDSAELVRQMNLIYERTRLRDDELAWIKKSDKRLIFWLWGYLKYNLQRELIKHPVNLDNDLLLPDVSKEQMPIRELKNNVITFNSKASNNQERYDAIIFALEANLIDGSRKRAFLSQLKVDWQTLVQVVPKLTWITGKPLEAENVLRHLTTMVKSSKYNKLHAMPRFELLENSAATDLPLGIQAILDFYYVDLLARWTEAYRKATPAQLPKLNTDVDNFRRAEVVKLFQKLRKAYDERQARAKAKKAPRGRICLSAKAQHLAAVIATLTGYKEMKIIEGLLQQNVDLLRAALPKY